MSHAKTAKRSTAAKLPYPDVTDPTGKLDWLIHYFHDLAKLQAINDLVVEMSKRKRGCVVLYALYEARRHLTNETKQSLAYAVKDGLLPFAHTGTTVLAYLEVSQ